MNRTWIELDREALAHNIRQYRNHLPAGCELMGVVKANAYGHGAVPFARELAKLGVRRFAVAALEEAAELREGGIEGEILILGYTHPDGFPQLLEHDICQTATCPAHAAQLEAFAREQGRRVKVHIAVDSGMHRIGFLPEELDEIERCCRSEWLDVTGIFPTCAWRTWRPRTGLPGSRSRFLRISWISSRPGACAPGRYTSSTATGQSTTPSTPTASPVSAF